MKKVICFILAALFLPVAGVFISAGKSADTSVLAENAVEQELYSDTWALTDARGKAAPGYAGVRAKRDDKYVGIFYHLWHNESFAGQSEVPNAHAIIEDDPNAVNRAWTGGAYYWGEPLYGYYNLIYDDYVLRQHALLLTYAGVDTIMVDFTNYYADGTHTPGAWNWDALMNLCKVWTLMQEEGLKVPKITLVMAFSNYASAGGVKVFYDAFYSKGLYENLWFYWNGKPLIIADKSAVAQADIQNFFTFRKGEPQYTRVTAENTWPWAAIYPNEPAYTADNNREMMVVTVAQNWGNRLDAMASIDAEGYYTARGRSWTSSGAVKSRNPLDPAFKTAEMGNIREQFERALDIDPDFLMVTGWNEWLAGLISGVWIGANSQYVNPMGSLVDAFTAEFSRDLEMTRTGSLGDNGYNLMVSYLRRFKGISANPSFRQEKKIGVDGGFSDWADVECYYRSPKGDGAIRDYKGLASYHYTNNTSRNDFLEIKVANDAENVYFYIRTADAITPYTDNAWMRLFLKTENTEKNWQGYNYVLNRLNPSAEHCVLERSTGGWNFETVSTEIPYKVNGSEMELAVPISALGLDKNDVDFEFKLHDNMQVQGDVYEFYINGDAAPAARFNYQYRRRQGRPAEDYTALYLEEAPGWDTRETAFGQVFAPGSRAGIRFEAAGAFDSVMVNIFARSTLDNVGKYLSASAIFRLYEFNGNYDSTVSAYPLKEVGREALYNNTAVKFDFGSPLKKGTYLVVMSDIGGMTGAGLYVHQFQEFNAVYANGKIMPGSAEISVRYADGSVSGAAAPTGEGGRYLAASIAAIACAGVGAAALVTVLVLSKRRAKA